MAYGLLAMETMASIEPAAASIEPAGASVKEEAEDEETVGSVVTRGVELIEQVRASGDRVVDAACVFWGQTACEEMAARVRRVAEQNAAAEVDLQRQNSFLVDLKHQNSTLREEVQRAAAYASSQNKVLTHRNIQILSRSCRHFESQASQPHTLVMRWAARAQQALVSRWQRKLSNRKEETSQFLALVREQCKDALAAAEAKVEISEREKESAQTATAEVRTELRAAREHIGELSSQLSSALSVRAPLAQLGNTMPVRSPQKCEDTSAGEPHMSRASVSQLLSQCHQSSQKINEQWEWLDRV